MSDTIKFDDTTLTAYAIGELPTDQVAAVEAYLATNATAREQVTAIRAAAAELQAALATEPATSLTLPQRAAILTAACGKPADGAQGRTARRRALAVAAALALAASGAVYVMAPTLNRAREVASTQGIGKETGFQQDTPLAAIPEMAVDKGSPASSALRQREAQAQSQRDTAMRGLITQTQTAIREGRYDNALDLTEQIRRLDPKNDYAIGVRPFIEEQAAAKPQRASAYTQQMTKVLNRAEEKKVPYDDVIRYPENWPDLSATHDRTIAIEPGGEKGTVPFSPPAGSSANSVQSDEKTTITYPPPANGTIDSEHYFGGSRVDVIRDGAAKASPGAVPNTGMSLSAPARKENLSASVTEVEASVTVPDGGSLLVGGQTLSGRKITLDQATISAGMQQQLGGPPRAEIKRLTPATPIDGEVTEHERRFLAEQLGEVFKNPSAQDPTFNTESYARIHDNPFLAAVQNPLSTFSIDVDTASYSNVRRFLTGGQLPPVDAVRIEELVNYFPYDYPRPDGDAPFAANVEVAGCPWAPEHRLVRVGLRGKDATVDKALADKPKNLVFLIDVSGSMQPANKLPMLKESMKMLVGELADQDKVTLAVYAGSSGLVLPPTVVGGEALFADPIRLKEGEEFNGPVPVRKVPGREMILAAIDRLEAGGSTNGAAGITLAYEQAQSAFIKDGVNRVILCTDGDFNVGVTNEGDLTRLIEEKAKSGVFLSVLGFGMGNVKDATMEKLADKGNGNYAYIDTLDEAKKTLVDGMHGTLVTIAKDVKIQVEFNPAKVGSYRLIGYENRVLAKEDFNDDKKDAGEIGAGHTVTALYEIVAAGVNPPATLPTVDPLKYQPTIQKESQPASDDLLTLKLRYKAPDAPLEQGTSKLLEFPVKDDGAAFAAASKDFKFAAAVAGYGMILRDSPHKGTATLAAVAEMAAEGKGADAAGYRAEFLELVQKAKALKEGR